MLHRAADWFFRDRTTGRITIAQSPNLLLWIFFALALTTLLVGEDGSLSGPVRAAAGIVLAFWAGDEVLRGVNPWRRCLGAGVLVWLLFRLLG